MKVEVFDNVKELNKFLETKPRVVDIKITSTLVEKRTDKRDTEWIFVDKFFVILK